METLIKLKDKVESFLRKRGFWAYYTSNIFGTTFSCWSFDGYKNEEQFERDIRIYVVWNFNGNDPKKTWLQLEINASRGDKEENNFVKGITNYNIKTSKDVYSVNPYDCDDTSTNMMLRIINNTIECFENLNKSYIKD